MTFAWINSRLRAPTTTLAACLLSLGLIACDEVVVGGPVPTAATTDAAAPVAVAPVASEAIAVEAPIANESGFAWAVVVSVDPEQRKLRVFEDGKELGPAESLHEEVRKTGMGSFSHWKPPEPGSPSYVYFSTSDNSDPNTNGRSYEFK